MFAITRHGRISARTHPAGTAPTPLPLQRSSAASTACIFRPPNPGAQSHSSNRPSPHTSTVCAGHTQQRQGPAAPQVQAQGQAAPHAQQLQSRSSKGSAAKAAFLTAWLGAAAASYKLLSDHQSQLPPLPLVPLTWALGGVLCVAASSLVLAKAVLGEKLHWEWHRGRLYIQAGVPSSGPGVPAGAVQVLPTKDRGNGAFAAAPIPCGSYLCDYNGQLLDRAQFHERYPDGVGKYATGLDEEWTIDAVDLVAQTNVFQAVHMNHSRRRWNVVRFFDRGGRRVSFFAARDIQPGEELLYDYGRGYWRGREHAELP